MKKNDLLLIGAGGHAAACIDVIESIGKFNIVGLVGLPSEIGSKKLGYEVIGSDKDLVALGEKYSNCLITLGQTDTPTLRINLFNKAKARNKELTTTVNSYEEFKKVLDEKTGFVYAHWDGTQETEEKIKEETKATIRCIPLNNVQEAGVCIYSGKPSTQRVLFARAY